MNLNISPRNLFFNNIAQTSPYPLQLHVIGAKDLYLYDSAGKAYMDMISGISVSCLGHCHPKVVEAVQKQAETFMHTLVYGEFVLSPQVQLAEMLTSFLPDNLQNVYFLNSGTEATEGAMKLAKRYTGRYEMVSCKNAYHGSTQGSASLMSSEVYTAAFRPLLPGISHIKFNHIDDIEIITNKTACVVMEVVQAEAGIIEPNYGYLQAVRQKCNETGTLLIFDEIQTGYGKTGHLFAFQKYGVVPDVLLLGKAMGGGMPLAAFIASKEIMSVLTHNPILGHITTFGGHPVNCAAGLATLQTIIEEKLIEAVEEKVALFLQNLVHPLINEIRHSGLMIAIDLGSNAKIIKTIEYCLENGLITDWFLFNDTSLRICPPLTITQDEIVMACEILKRGLEAS
jgi:acetylornithine/succinyldiaminopimelate/putrescine aminotransferase